MTSLGLDRGAALSAQPSRSSGRDSRPSLRHPAPLPFSRASAPVCSTRCKTGVQRIRSGWRSGRLRSAWSSRPIHRSRWQDVGSSSRGADRSGDGVHCRRIRRHADWCVMGVRRHPDLAGRVAGLHDGCYSEACSVSDRSGGDRRDLGGAATWASSRSAARADPAVTKGLPDPQVDPDIDIDIAVPVLLLQDRHDLIGVDPQVVSELAQVPPWTSHGRTDQRAHLAHIWHILLRYLRKCL
jgi:hypothetical protein